MPHICNENKLKGRNEINAVFTWRKDISSRINYVLIPQQHSAQICLLQTKLGLICENLCSRVQEHSSRDNELIDKVHADSFSHFVWKISPSSASAGSPQSISQVGMLESIDCQCWRLNAEHSGNEEPLLQPTCCLPWQS